MTWALDCLWVVDVRALGYPGVWAVVGLYLDRSWVAVVGSNGLPRVWAVFHPLQSHLWAGEVAEPCLWAGEEGAD